MRLLSGLVAGPLYSRFHEAGRRNCVRHRHICCGTVKLRALVIALLAFVAAVLVAAGCGGSDKSNITVIQVGEGPTDLAAAFGSIWVVNGDAVTRVDPKTNAVQLKQF